MFKNLTFKRLFLLDGFGAIITALLLSLVMARFEDFFGMPSPIVYWLAGGAACFALYSFICYRTSAAHQASFLMGIAIANTTYCLVTLGLVIGRFNTLTWWGIAYFVGEVIVVMALVRIEIRFAQKAKPGQ